MYKGYLETKYGIIEITAEEKYLTGITIIKTIPGDSSINENKIVKEAKKQLKEYFDGKLDKFNLPIYFDNSFKSRVLKSLYETPTGDVLTYKTLAEMNDSKAHRAVGTAMATNKIPIIIPCHRVIKSDGSVGNYYYGSKMKEDLLLLEAEYLFLKKCTKVENFSKNEQNMLISHPTLKKMFDVMKPIKNYIHYNTIFTCVISQIIYQQIGYKTAKKQEILFYKLCNYEVTKEKLMKMDDKEFKKIGISGFRLKYIRNTINSDIDFVKLSEYSDEKIYEILTSIKGIGTWTVEMVLLFGMSRSHVISYKDLIIINGLKQLYKLENISLSKFNEIVSTFNGFESIVSINLWSYIEKGYYKKH